MKTKTKQQCTVRGMKETAVVQLLKAEGRTLLAPCEEVVTFLPLCVCVRALLLFALGVTGTPLTVVKSLEVLKETCRCGAYRDVVKWWTWQSGVNA